MMFSQIQLPIFILLHALGLVAIGNKLLFLDRPEKAMTGLATIGLGVACKYAERQKRGSVDNY